MAKQIMFKAQNESLRAYLRGKRSFKFFGVTLTIQHAHDNEYQVLLPDLSEIFRQLAGGKHLPTLCQQAFTAADVIA